MPNPAQPQYKHKFFSRTDSTQGRISWGEKHEKFIEEGTILKRGISFFGDSLISNFWRSPKLLQCGPEPVNNFGIGGDKIENVLWRLLHGEVPKHSKLIIIHVGTNNVKHDSISEVIHGFRAICEAIWAAAPLASVCISTILPRSCSPYTDQKILEINGKLIECVPCWASELGHHCGRP